MNDFEESMMAALRRVDAPTGLADAVMSRVTAERRPPLPFRMPLVWMQRMAAILLLTAMLFGAGIAGLVHKHAVERTRAEQDFARSQELTSRALEPVRRHLRRAGIALDE